MKLPELSKAAKPPETVQADAPVDDLIGYPQAARVIGIPVGTLYAWVHERRVPHVRLGARIVRFSRRALAAWLTELSVPPVVPVRQNRE